MRKIINDFVKFQDASLSRKWTGKKVPISRVYEAYMEGQIDIPAEHWEALFDSRHETMSFGLTDTHFKWAFTNFLPEVAIHSKEPGQPHRW